MKLDRRHFLTLALTAIPAVAVSGQARRKARKRAKPKAPQLSVSYLLQGSVAVPGRFYSIPFYVGIGGGVVSGRFEVRGGGRNDIMCYILDEDQYTNYSNGNPIPSTYYNSERVTVANIDARLGRGRYYLVFHNDAWFDAKTVYGSITLTMHND